MIASKDEYLKEASQTMFRMSADDLVRKRCRDREEYYQDLRNYERAIAERERTIEENERKREQDRIEHEQDLRNYERAIAEKEQDYQRVAAENEKLRAELERLKKS